METSNRAKTLDREKVKKKVRDSRKKNAKLAKKNFNGRVVSR